MIKIGYDNFMSYFLTATIRIQAKSTQRLFIIMMFLVSFTRKVIETEHMLSRQIEFEEIQCESKSCIDWT